jgi:hypothetical protein
MKNSKKTKAKKIVTNTKATKLRLKTGHKAGARVE